MISNATLVEYKFARVEHITWISFGKTIRFCVHLSCACFYIYKYTIVIINIKLFIYLFYQAAIKQKIPYPIESSPRKTFQLIGCATSAIIHSRCVVRIIYLAITVQMRIGKRRKSVELWWMARYKFQTYQKNGNDQIRGVNFFELYKFWVCISY